MKKERRGNEKWNMLVVQGILVVFAIPVLYLAKKEKKRKKEKGEYVGCAALLLVVDATLVLYYNSNWLLQMHKSPSIIPLWKFKTFKNKKRKKMVQKKPLIIFFEVAVLQTQTNDKSLSALYQKRHLTWKWSQMEVMLN